MAAGAKQVLQTITPTSCKNGSMQWNFNAPTDAFAAGALALRKIDLPPQLAGPAFGAGPSCAACRPDCLSLLLDMLRLPAVGLPLTDTQSEMSSSCAGRGCNVLESAALAVLPTAEFEP